MSHDTPSLEGALQLAASGAPGYRTVIIDSLAGCGESTRLLPRSWAYCHDQGNGIQVYCLQQSKAMVEALSEVLAEEFKSHCDAKAAEMVSIISASKMGKQSREPVLYTAMSFARALGSLAAGHTKGGYRGGQHGINPDERCNGLLR